VSDPTSQPPLPGRNPAWNPENEPTLPYYEPQPQQPQYGQQPQAPQYGQPPPPYGQQPPAYYAQQPPPGYPNEPGLLPAPAKTRTPWLLAGAIALVVATVGGATVFVVSRAGGDASAGPPVPSGSYTDGLSQPSPEPSDDPTPSDEPTEPPTSEPVPSPTPTEKVRTLKDIDKGLQVYDDVYVELAGGWRKFRGTKYSVTLGAQGRGVAVVLVSPIGYPAASAVPSVVRTMIEVDHLTGVQKGPVKTLRPANSNIASQAQMTFSGRYKQNGGTVSLTGRCTTMTGVESIHNVTVTLCVEARKDDPSATFRDATRMLASVARSI
jgi:cytoskeletal protein RodZ